MNSIPIPHYATAATREAIALVNARVRDADAALSAAQRAANEARQADPLTADVDQVLAAGDNLRRARVDHLRAEIAIRRDTEPVFAALAADHRAALRAVEQELAETIRQVEAELAAAGWGALLATKDQFGNRLFDSLVNDNARVAPLRQRAFTLKLALADGAAQENKRELANCMAKLKAEFQKAADGAPATKSRRMDEVFA